MSQQKKLVLNEEKYYTFDVLDQVNIKLDICNFSESFKNLDEAYILHNTILYEEYEQKEQDKKN